MAKNENNAWPELAIGLYDKLTGRGAEITYDFDNVDVWVPSAPTENAQMAHWRVNGTVRISTRDNAAS